MSRKAGTGSEFHVVLEKLTMKLKVGLNVMAGAYRRTTAGPVALSRVLAMVIGATLYVTALLNVMVTVTTAV